MASLVLCYTRAEMAAIVRRIGETTQTPLVIRKTTVKPNELDPDRPKKIKAQIRSWIEECQARRVYSFGLCGAISDGLLPGNVVFVEAACEYTGRDVSSKFRSLHCGLSLSRDQKELLDKATIALGELKIAIGQACSICCKPQFYRAKAATADWFPVPSQYAAMATNQNNASHSEKWVVEQEEFHLLQLAAELGIEYYPVRAVTDPLDLTTMVPRLQAALDSQITAEGKQPCMAEYLRTVPPEDLANIQLSARDDDDLLRAIFVRFLYQRVKDRIAEHCVPVLQTVVQMFEQ